MDISNMLSDDFEVTSWLMELIPKSWIAHQQRNRDRMNKGEATNLFDTVDIITPYEKFSLPNPPRPTPTINPDRSTNIPNTNQPNYKCWKCGQMFNTESWLRKHTFRCRANRRTKIPRKEDDRKFVCETCGSDFIYSHALVRHIRIHTGERPYECFHCPKKFIDSGDRKKHIRRHHNNDHCI